MKKLFLSSLFSEVGEKILELVPDPSTAKVAFIPTAADRYKEKPWMEEDRKKFLELGFSVKDYDIKGKDERSHYKDLRDKEIIFVSGGNTFYLLDWVRKSGFDKAVARLLAEGKLYVGASAGSIIVGPTIEPIVTLDNPNEAPELTSYKGLGFVDFVMIPHYGREKYKKRHEAIFKEWSGKVSLRPVNDQQVIIV